MRKIHALVIALLLGTLAAPAYAHAQGAVVWADGGGPEVSAPASEAPALAPTTPDDVLERGDAAAQDLSAGHVLLGIGGVLWALFTLLRLPQLGAQLERVPAAWRPLLVLGSGLLAAGVFAVTGVVPAGLLEALGLGAGGAGLAMGAHDVATPVRHAVQARRGGGILR